MISDPTFSSDQNLPARWMLDQSKTGQRRDTLPLNSCLELEWITVKTRRNVYDIVVLSAESGMVAVRGGAILPEFTHASFIGSLWRGIATNRGAVVVGRCLEFVVHGQSIITSPVESFSRCHLPVVEGRA